MKTKIYKWQQLSVLALTIGLAMTACSPDNGEGENDTSDEPIDLSVDASIDGLQAKVQFYHAWLADCVNDTSFISQSKAETELTKLAKGRIRGAIKDPNIVHGFGTELKEELVWGPVVVVNSSPGGRYSSANLMYCVKSTINALDVEYSIGIAGTNEISSYDWFTEDFEVSKTTPWMHGGNVSIGSSNGFRVLQSMRHNGQTLAEFIKKDSKSLRAARISVSGHSLGGTLTQVYSSYINNYLSHEPVYVATSAYVYAGPTAGDDAFGKALTNQLDGYYAYNNSLDLIPHAWEPDQLDQLCTKYDNLPMCGKRISNNAGINGVVEYLKLISASGKYKMPVIPQEFDGSPARLTGEQCGNLDNDINNAWALGMTPYPSLDSITLLCAGAKVTKSEFSDFMYYFTEMGYQHTTPYANYFLPIPVRSALPKYMPRSGSTRLRELQGVIILQRFMQNASNTLYSTGTTNCGCSQ